MTPTTTCPAPALSPREAEWVSKLLAATDSVPQRLSTLLQTEFFNETSGRALILQPARAFGYYYLRQDIHDQAERLAAEIKALLDLCILLARLRSHGLIYLLRSDAQDSQDMIYISDLFQAPHAASAHLVLNGKGDYTFDPATIQNQQDEVLYRGIKLDGELFHLVHDAANGMLAIPDACRAQLATLLPATATPAAPAASDAVPAAMAPPRWRRPVLCLLLAVLLVAAGTAYWRYAATGSLLPI